MGIILLICFIVFEVALMISSFFRFPEKKQWLVARCVFRAGELAVFLFVMLLPNVTFDFKYKLCFALLIIRLAGAVVMYLIRRTTATGKRSKAGAVFGAAGSIVILTVSLVPAFIFTEYAGLETSGEYEVAQAAAILIDKDRVETFETDGSNREIPVHFYYPKTDVIAQSSCPVVLFSHGAFGYYESNTSTYMELASNGYVVISLDHPYHSFFTEDTDGKLITVDPAFLQEVMYVNENNTPETDIHDLSHKWLEIRTADISCVLDSVEEAKQSGTVNDAWFIENEEEKSAIESVLAMADVDKIGLMGHSLGGAASVSVGRYRDDVDAVIDLDGTMLGEQIGYADGKYQYEEEPYPVPLFALDSESHYYYEGQKYGNLYVNHYVLEHAVDAKHEFIAGAAHMNFTDLPLFAPPLASMLGTGTVDATECIETMNAMVLEYMNCYLKTQAFDQ
ncbi:MAG: dienelactone hydrolase family protein [Eubacterium sp.]|nr:dienelactone hydrolase family protein [Eubacterium sp.]